MTWKPKVGDIGRFCSENKRYPRFTVVQVLDTVVQVWYSGALKSQTVPRKTFDTDCTDVWIIDVVKDTPTWLKKGAKFRAGTVTVTLSKVVNDDRTHRWMRTHREERLSLRDQTLEVYSMRADHAACLIHELKTLVLIPTKLIAEHGYRIRTRWDIILDDDEFDDYDDWL